VSEPDAGRGPETPDGGQPQHDPDGLDVARSLAARLQGSARSASRRRRDSGRTRRPGDQPTLSGAGPDGRDPALLGTALDRLVADSGWETDVAVRGVFGRWEAIVGAEVAAHCTPVSFHDGHLAVRADSTSWATQLRLLAATVVRRLNEELGHETVLRIDISGPEAPSWRKGPRSVRGGRGPRDTYG